MPGMQPIPVVRPSRLLRFISAVIALLWWPCVIATLLFALAWGALHGLIVPRIGDLRPRLETQLTKALGVPVQIGNITAQFNLLAPAFEFTGVRLKDTAGRDALVLNKIIATLSPRSLLQLGFEQLVIEQPELDVRRNAQGRIVVGGFALPEQTAPDEKTNPAADWIFSQRELAIRGGTVRWTDELRGVQPLQLTQVDAVVRNPGRKHILRVDATPPAGWGQRFSVMADMRRPLMSSQSGQWREWAGQLYADFAQVDVSQLKRYVNLDVDVARGQGALRAWAQVEQGQVTQATADMALSDVQVTLGRDLKALAMPSISGRLSGQTVDGGLRIATKGLAFKTQEGIVWPGGNLSYLQTGQDAAKPAVGELSADKLDLSALSQIADRLPIGTATHGMISSLAPQGLVEVVRASWKGHISAPTSYEAQGKVKNLSIASDTGKPGKVLANGSTALASSSRPGVRGASIDFKLNQQGGQAALSIAKGALILPDAFEEPTLVFDSLKTDAKWTLQGDQIDLKLDNLSFANQDGQGTAKVHWQTSNPAKSRSKSRYPGVLDLQGTLSRANGAKIYRYLPIVMSKLTREYVRNAVTQGNVNNGTFNIKGDLFDIPFADPKQGEFRIVAQIDDTNFTYIPPSLQANNTLTWPSLAQVSGELVFDRLSLSVNKASGRLGTNSLQITKADARIPDLAAPFTTVLVNADARGSLADVVNLVNTSPLYNITSQSLSKAVVSGNAEVKLSLNLPLNNIEKSKVSGSITLAGNDVQITPDTPKLANAKGIVQFSETGFAVKDVQARMLGGDMRLDGGSRANAGPDEAGLLFRAQGTVAADSLRQAKELGFASRLGQHLTGSSAYTATLAFRRGIPELSIASDLVGMAVNLPPPLAKTIDTALPLRYENALVRESLAPGQKLQDYINVDLGQIANIMYVRDISGPEVRVLRGGIGVGLSQGETATPIDNQVRANINFSQVNADAWQKVLGSTTGASNPESNVPSAVTATAADSGSAFNSYLPSVIAVRARELVLAGRTLNNVVVGGSREGINWRANLDARELNGYLEYRQPSGASLGRVYARLARLNLAQSAATDLEAALDSQPNAIPALDIIVDDFELLGKKLGRVEIEAINRGAGALARDSAVREWRLNKLNITLPEAQLVATGNWVAVSAANESGAASAAVSSLRPSQRRRTAMNFKLDIADSGKLLQRFGMDKVIAKGKGKMEGQISWLGSPLALDYPSLSGNFNINIEEGQFLQADPGIAKLIGVLSLQSLPRRLTLDFRDVFTEGFSFDFVRGDVKVDQGVASTNNLQMKGVNAAVLIEGTADIAKATQDVKVVVVPELNAGTASLVATIINPAIGIGTFLAQLILRRPLLEAATFEYRIEGPWADRKVTKIDRKPAHTDKAPNETQQ
jgi:uncharacterized protein (TIGR02099 family)